MDISILKYYSLGPHEKKEVSDFIDLLFSRKKKKKPQNTSDYKRKILSVSTWDDADLKIFEENNDHFKQWPPKTW